MSKPTKPAPERPKTARNTNVTLLEAHPTGNYRDAHACAFCGALGYRHVRCGASARLFCSPACHAHYKHDLLRPRKSGRVFVPAPLAPKQRRATTRMTATMGELLRSPVAWAATRRMAQ